MSPDAVRSNRPARSSKSHWRTRADSSEDRVREFKLAQGPPLAPQAILLLILSALLAAPAQADDCVCSTAGLFTLSGAKGTNGAIQAQLSGSCGTPRAGDAWTISNGCKVRIDAELGTSNVPMYGDVTVTGAGSEWYVEPGISWHFAGRLTCEDGGMCPFRSQILGTFPAGEVSYPDSTHVTVRYANGASMPWDPCDPDVEDCSTQAAQSQVHAADADPLEKAVPTQCYVGNGKIGGPHFASGGIWYPQEFLEVSSTTADSISFVLPRIGNRRYFGEADAASAPDGITSSNEMLEAPAGGRQEDAAVDVSGYRVRNAIGESEWTTHDTTPSRRACDDHGRCRWEILLDPSDTPFTHDREMIGGIIYTPDDGWGARLTQTWVNDPTHPDFALAVGLTGLDFHAATDTIVRTGGQPWDQDGFEVGMQIRISGTSQNDGIFTITGITTTNAPLDTLEFGDVIAAEANQAGATITSARAPIVVVWEDPTDFVSPGVDMNLFFLRLEEGDALTCLNMPQIEGGSRGILRIRDDAAVAPEPLSFWSLNGGPSGDAALTGQTDCGSFGQCTTLLLEPPPGFRADYVLFENMGGTDDGGGALSEAFAITVASGAAIHNLHDWSIRHVSCRWPAGLAGANPGCNDWSPRPTGKLPPDLPRDSDVSSYDVWSDFTYEFITTKGMYTGALHMAQSPVIADCKNGFLGRSFLGSHVASNQTEGDVELAVEWVEERTQAPGCRWDQMVAQHMPGSATFIPRCSGCQGVYEAWHTRYIVYGGDKDQGPAGASWGWSGSATTGFYVRLVDVLTDAGIHTALPVNYFALMGYWQDQVGSTSGLFGGGIKSCHDTVGAYVVGGSYSLFLGDCNATGADNPLPKVIDSVWLNQMQMGALQWIGIGFPSCFNTFLWERSYWHTETGANGGTWASINPPSGASTCAFDLVIRDSTFFNLEPSPRYWMHAAVLGNADQPNAGVDKLVLENVWANRGGVRNRGSYTGGNEPLVLNGWPQSGWETLQLSDAHAIDGEGEGWGLAGGPNLTMGGGMTPDLFIPDKCAGIEGNTLCDLDTAGPLRAGPLTTWWGTAYMGLRTLPGINNGLPLARYLPDYMQVELGVPDSDGDGLRDPDEASGCTDPNDADSDDDGIVDGDEDADHDTVQDPGETDPCDADTDDDGVQDGTERGYTVGHPTGTGGSFQPDLDPTTTTDPLDADTDGDGWTDGEEDSNSNGRVDAGESDPNAIPSTTSLTQRGFLITALLLMALGMALVTGREGTRQ